MVFCNVFFWVFTFGFLKQSYSADQVGLEIHYVVYLAGLKLEVILLSQPLWNAEIKDATHHTWIKSNSKIICKY